MPVGESEALPVDIRHGYDLKALCEQFDAKPAEIRQLLRGGEPGVTGEVRFVNKLFDLAA